MFLGNKAARRDGKKFERHSQNFFHLVHQGYIWFAMRTEKGHGISSMTKAGEKRQPER